MTPLASWIIVIGVFVVGVCIGILGAVWFTGLDEPPYDDELKEER